MKEIIADLTTLTSDNVGGTSLADHGIVQQLENMLLDYAGEVICIKVTIVRGKRRRDEIYN